MAHERIPARRLLRRWRETQEPKVTQDDCGAYIGKTGALIRMFETGRTDLDDADCMTISERTQIPLAAFLPKSRRERIKRAAALLEPAPDAPVATEAA